MRVKKKVTAKDYDTLISECEDKIEKLTHQLKVERVNLKTLKKNKIDYEIQLEEERKKAELESITKLILNSGKTLEEIKKLLSSTE